MCGPVDNPGATLFMGWLKGAQPHPALQGLEDLEGSPWKAPRWVGHLLPNSPLSELEDLYPSTSKGDGDLPVQPEPGAISTG